MEQSIWIAPPKEVVPHFTSKANLTTQRLLGQTMYLEHGPLTQELVEAYIAATGRKVPRVEMIVDAFHDMTSEGCNLVYDQILSRTHSANLFNLAYRLLLHQSAVSSSDISRRLATYERNQMLVSLLIKAGVDLTVTNTPKSSKQLLTHWQGRNHAKLLVADNLGVLPCFNLGDCDYKRPDLAVLTENPAIVEPLVQVFTDQRNGQAKQDRDYPCPDGQSKLLYDAGIPGRSLILDNTLKFIQDAKKSVIYCSHVAPDGKVRRALEQARGNGIQVDIAIPSWDAITDPLLRISSLISFWKMKTSSLPIYYHPSWVHAKYLGVDKEIVSVGSHPQAEISVNAGTAELNLVSRNTDLVSQIYQFHDNLKSNQTK